MGESDAVLLTAVRRELLEGGSDAFEKILLRYEKLIHHITRRYFSNYEDALDASQEAILRVYKGLPRVVLPESGSLKSWICAITANVCLDEKRKRRAAASRGFFSGFARTDESHYEETEAYEASAEENVLARERVNEIFAAMDKLPKTQKMQIILRDMLDLSYEEMAETMGANIGTIKSRLSRARASLRKLLNGTNNARIR